MVVFQACSWHAQDEDEMYQIHIFGRTEDGKSVCLTSHFQPYFFVRLGNASEEHSLKELIHERFPNHFTSALVYSKDIWGFQNGKKWAFAKLTFNCLGALRECESILRYGKYGNKIYESNLEPVLRFMHRSGVESTGWLDSGETAPNDVSFCDIDVIAPNWKKIKPVNRDDPAPFRICSFDLECYSSTGAFPNPQLDADCVFQVGLTTRTWDGKYIDETCLCFKNTSDVDGVKIVSFKTEAELIRAVDEYVREMDVDIITGYNIFGFDFEFLYTRAVINKVSLNFSRLQDHTSELMQKRLSSSALGDNFLKILSMPGRFVFDLMKDIQREKKLESYSLNNVSKVFIGDQKIDMTPKEMFRRFKEGNADKLSEVAMYCVKDTKLPHQLMDKLKTLPNLLEMAKACWVPLNYLTERGQQIKVFSQASRKARELGFMIPRRRYDPRAPPEEYVGATVLEAQTGAYYKPITALDFASLYPSIMVAHNLCYSSMVMDKRFANVPGVEYEEFTVGDKTFRFAQNVPSVLPTILTELKKFRKQAKKDMAAARGTPMEAIYDGKQLAYKISMNSIYGFTGASKGTLPLVAIASTTTTVGRNMIEQTKNYVENNFPGANVRYGDSVTPDTALLVRIGGVVQTKRIDELVSSYNVRDDGKEVAPLTDIEVWTENGFSRIQQVVRHKTTKNIHRVLTHTGMVDVTDDHSLLREDASEISPKDAPVGMKLLHGNCMDAFVATPCGITVAEAKVMGFFYGDGSCGKYGTGSKVKNTWALNNRNMDYLSEMQDLCPFPTRIFDTLASSGVYKLGAIGDVKGVVARYRSMFYNGAREKVVPSEILTAPMDIVQAFWDGYYMADGDKSDLVTARCDNKGKQGTMGLYILAKRLGYNVSINTRGDKMNIFRLNLTRETLRKDPTAIKRNVSLGPTDGFVYDLTTENHHFHVGPGEMVVHNTDSVMIEFDVGKREGKEAIEYSWEIGERAAAECTKLFKAPNDLELEKVYCPYFLYSKKRYAAKMWVQEKGEMKMEKVDIKGLQVVRRDNAPYVRDVCKELLDVILESPNRDGAIELARQRADELMKGKVPIEKLTLTKLLAAEYKVKGVPQKVTDDKWSKEMNHPHVTVYRRTKRREPGSEPQIGDRVPFVVVNGRGEKMFQNADDPKWVTENAVSINYNYYFNNQLRNPVCELLSPLVKNPDEIFKDVRVPKKVFAKHQGGPTLKDLFAKMIKE
jgi:DNA polymerase elongation subunit (family B)